MVDQEKILLVLIRDPFLTEDRNLAERSKILYQEIVDPAAREAGFKCLRIDPTEYGRDDKRLFQLLSSADAFLVDASAGSMDYLYSLGVRHALTDKPSFIIVEEDNKPFDIDIATGVYYVRPHFYTMVEEVDRVRHQLIKLLRNTSVAKPSYSPVINALENAPRVFLSYAHSDRESVAAVDQWLRDKGARVDIDDRELVAGRDIRDEIIRMIERAGKVVCFYSKSSSDRYYTKLERRLTEEVELKSQMNGNKRVVLIYFRLDDTALPPESAYKLAINAWTMSFDDACAELWRHLQEKPAEPRRISLSRYREHPPWEKSTKDNGDAS